ncbi:hypothetical protein GGD68_006112 [Paraburkholderia fungorum]|uniref:Uncharacterized protein n=1 Tax=Paraburkholderia fungorum TaxID=134537 RepID=A0AAW3V1L6_9BURK|nr:hypothetical protein [Paraburkholderia fungorum]MBB6204378.1 hypothetical protein [Paraburkholderia fungorum]
MVEFRYEEGRWLVANVQQKGKRPTAHSCFEVHERYPLFHAPIRIAPRDSARI